MSELLDTLARDANARVKRWRVAFTIGLGAFAVTLGGIVGENETATSWWCARTTGTTACASDQKLGRLDEPAREHLRLAAYDAQTHEPDASSPLRRLLAIEALHEAGQTMRARTLADELLAQAKATKDAHYAAEAAYLGFRAVAAVGIADVETIRRGFSALALAQSANDNGLRTHVSADLARALLLAGKRQQAERLLADVDETIRRQAWERTPAAIAQAMAHATLHLHYGDAELAFAELERANEIADGLYLPGGLVQSELARRLADVHFALSNEDQALWYANRALAMRRKLFGNREAGARVIEQTRGNALSLSGNTDEAIAAYERSIAAIKRGESDDNVLMAVVLNALAATKARGQSPTAGRAELERALAILRHHVGPEDPGLAVFRMNLAIRLINYDGPLASNEAQLELQRAAELANMVAKQADDTLAPGSFKRAMLMKAAVEILLLADRFEDARMIVLREEPTFERDLGSPERLVDHDVSDIVQDTLITALACGDKLRQHASFRGFLFGIARNKLLQSQRKTGTYQRRMDRVVEEGASPRATTPTSPSPRISKNEDARRVQAAIESLPTDFRLVVKLFYWEDMSVDEIAEVMETSPGTVKSRLSRSRVKLGAMLRA